jgi:hypothetical protein
VLFRFGLPSIGSYASSTPATVAAALRAAVSCGTLETAGRQSVDGIDAIELKSRPNSLIAETIWVSPGTYLPVRVVVGPGLGGFGAQQTADITWLTPTAQNLAKLTVPIPASFHQVTFTQGGTPLLRNLPAGLLPKQVAFCLPAAGPDCLSATSGVPRPAVAPKFPQATSG